ncbi:hypothetical protein CEXT_226321 [Caerostris extrusa]|uniref:Uncharacterized protein n=1 Tax=Caerostris extrusa TaxID=172846 RepID=A0AAV4XF71_CAEEX|nr:hypothetical protein CEXT_226321 [Caerostris extrusa]
MPSKGSPSATLRQLPAGLSILPISAQSLAPESPSLVQGKCLFLGGIFYSFGAYPASQLSGGVFPHLHVLSEKRAPILCTQHSPNGALPIVLGVSNIFQMCPETPPR